MIPFKGRWIDRNKVVHVYRNLAARGNPKLRWSIRQGSVIVGHSDQLLLYRAEMVIQPAGVERGRQTGQKNVHAYIRGMFCDELTYLNLGGRPEITITPEMKKIPPESEWITYDSRDGKFYRHPLHQIGVAIPVDFGLGVDRCRDWALFTQIGVLVKKA